ncbi:MAG: hypothetical protein C4533_08200 [Candidatus Omnitrophota bacterium]|jgi:uncharacterized coiled-coil protein SlyX|nr:MAG: hypothetical protein C4533_08200 [Candidatus Omnitrophota bacterium]
MKRTVKGLSTIEYAVFICIFIAALMAMRIYLQRNIQQKYRESADVFGQGEQYALNVTQATDLDGGTLDIDDNIFDDGTIATPSEESCQSIRDFVGNYEDQIIRMAQQIEALGENGVIGRLNLTQEEGAENNAYDLMSEAADEWSARQHATSGELSALNNFKNTLQDDIDSFGSIIFTFNEWIVRLLDPDGVRITAIEVAAVRSQIEQRAAADQDAIDQMDESIAEFNGLIEYYDGQRQELLDKAQALRDEAASLTEAEAQANIRLAQTYEDEAQRIQDMTIDELQVDIDRLENYKAPLEQDKEQLDDMAETMEDWEDSLSSNPFFNIPVSKVTQFRNQLSAQIGYKEAVIVFGSQLNQDIEDLGYYASLYGLSAQSVRTQRDSVANALSGMPGVDSITGAVDAINGSIEELNERIARYQQIVEQYRNQYPSCFAS